MLELRARLLRESFFRRIQAGLKNRTIVVELLTVDFCYRRFLMDALLLYLFSFCLSRARCFTYGESRKWRFYVHDHIERRVHKWLAAE